MAMKKALVDGQALLGEVAYEAVREAILNNDFKPGDRVSEYKVAEWLGISRTPAREGLRRLESEGLLSAHPRRGLVVASIDDEAFEQLYAVRALLEGEAAASAARSASDADIATLKHLVQAESEIFDDAPQMWEHNRAFHDVIYRASHNKFLLKFLLITADTLSAYRDVSTLIVEERRREVVEEHRELCEAIASRDAEAARTVAVRHVKNALRMRTKVRHSNLVGEVRRRGDPNAKLPQTNPFNV
jgi:DNA-binding GntR family transcriptional regulator